MKKRLTFLIVLAIMITVFATPVLACTFYTQGAWERSGENYLATESFGNQPEWSVDPDEDFLYAYGDTDMSWLEVLQTPVKGDPWISLAHQYIAAYLSLSLDGLDSSDWPYCMEEAAGWLDQGPNSFTFEDVSGLINHLDQLNNNLLNWEQW